jgi:hypothetical protein
MATYPGRELTLTVGLDATAGQPQEAPKVDCAKIGLAAINDKETVANNFEMLNVFFIFSLFKVYRIVYDANIDLEFSLSFKERLLIFQIIILYIIS